MPDFDLFKYSKQEIEDKKIEIAGADEKKKNSLKNQINNLIVEFNSRYPNNTENYTLEIVEVFDPWKSNKGQIVTGGKSRRMKKSRRRMKKSPRRTKKSRRRVRIYI